MSNKIKVRAKARSFSHARRDDIDGEARVTGVPSMRHGSVIEPGWTFVAFERAGFELTFQMRLAQIVKLHEELGKAIADAQSVENCTRKNCYSCERAARDAKESA